MRQAPKGEMFVGFRSQSNIAMAIDLIYHLEYHGLLGFNGIFNGIYNGNIMGYTLWLCQNSY